MFHFFFQHQRPLLPPYNCWGLVLEMSAATTGVEVSNCFGTKVYGIYLQLAGHSQLSLWILWLFNNVKCCPKWAYGMIYDATFTFGCIMFVCYVPACIFIMDFLWLYFIFFVAQCYVHVFLWSGDNLYRISSTTSKHFVST